MVTKTTLYGRNDAAKFLNISGTAFDRLVQNRILVPEQTTPGGRRRYSLYALEQYKKTLQTGHIPKPNHNFESISQLFLTSPHLCSLDWEKVQKHIANLHYEAAKIILVQDLAHHHLDDDAKAFIQNFITLLTECDITVSSVIARVMQAVSEIEKADHENKVIQAQAQIQAFWDQYQTGDLLHVFAECPDDDNQLVQQIYMSRLYEIVDPKEQTVRCAGYVYKNKAEADMYRTDRSDDLDKVISLKIKPEHLFHPTYKPLGNIVEWLMFTDPESEKLKRIGTDIIGVRYQPESAKEKQAALNLEKAEQLLVKLAYREYDLHFEDNAKAKRSNIYDGLLEYPNEVKASYKCQLLAQKLGEIQSLLGGDSPSLDQQ